MVLSGLSQVYCRKFSQNDSSDEEGTPQGRGSIKLMTPEGPVGKEIPVIMQSNIIFSFREN